MAGANGQAFEQFQFSDDITKDFRGGFEKLNVICRLGRITRMLIETRRQGFPIERYANAEALKECDGPRKSRNNTHFREFLCTFKEKEHQQLFFEFFTFLGWEEADIIRVMGHLTHFICLRAHGKQDELPWEERQHLPGCMQCPHLTDWQRSWFPVNDGERNLEGEVNEHGEAEGVDLIELSSDEDDSEDHEAIEVIVITIESSSEREDQAVGEDVIELFTW